MTTPTPNPTPRFIDATQLARLTGLSERRLRQLAQFGAIPPAKRHRYPLAETLRGIFRYYRQQDQESALRDEYPTLAACSKATGIPLAVLYQAQRLGCPALAGGRVRLAPFLQWFYTHQVGSSIDLEAQQILRLRLQNAKLECVLKLHRDELLPADTVHQVGADLGRAVRKVVTRVHLLAPSLVGLPVEQIEERLREVEREIDGLVEQGLDLEKVWQALATEAERLSDPAAAEPARSAASRPGCPSPRGP